MQILCRSRALGNSVYMLWEGVGSKEVFRLWHILVCVPIFLKVARAMTTSFSAGNNE